MKPMSSVPLSRREVLCRLPVRLGALLLLTRASRARAQGRVPVPCLHRVVFDDDRFLAVGAGGAVVTSDDGDHWVAGRSGTRHDLRGVTRAEGAWVVVGDQGVILTSPDGDRWSLQKSPVEALLLDVAFGHCRLVAVGASGTILRSFDGVGWVRAESGVATELRCVADAESGFLVGGANHTLLRSRDGIRWSGHNPAGPCGIRHLLRSERGLLAVGCNGVSSFAPERWAWELTLRVSNPALHAAAEGAGVRVVVGDHGTVFVAAAAGVGAGAGMVWRQVPSGTARALRSVAYGRGRFVAVGVGNTVIVSRDGRQWRSARHRFAARSEPEEDGVGWG